jgi:tetratricopeptide (TPR) repeat protein
MGDRAHATALYNQGVEAANAKNYPAHLQHAYQCFSSACYADPTWAQAFYQAGNNNVDQKMQHSAVACYRRALQCEAPPEDRAKSYSNLSWQLAEMGRIDESLECALKAIELDPALVQAHLNLSICYRDLDDSKKSLEHAEQAMALDKDNNHTEIAVAFACLFDRQFMRGLKHFEKRFEWRLHHFLNYPYPQWKGEEGKVVFLVADQGLGDTLSYARFVRELCKRSKYVHACVQHELLRLFQHAFRDIPNLNLLPGLNSNFPAADAWTTFVSLPYALGLTDEEYRNAPQIEPPVYALPKSWKVQDRKMHIGIAWRGSALNDIDRHRNLPPHEFLELYRVPGIQLYSLQVGEHSQDLVNMGGAPVVQDLTTYIHDVVDTVSLVRELDLVITVESALGHICALAGVECWIPYSYYGRDYRIGLTGEDMIWTPRHRVFRQDKTAQWHTVFQAMKESLEQRLSSD